MRIKNSFFQKTGQLSFYMAEIMVAALSAFSPEKQDKNREILPDEFGMAAT